MTVTIENSNKPMGRSKTATKADAADMMPEEHVLQFPPFPALDSTASGIKPFDEYVVRGVNVPSRSMPSGPTTDKAIRHGLDGWAAAVTEHGIDSHGNPFVTIPAGTSSTKHKLAPGRVALEDSWKLATNPDWVDPPPKFPFNNDIARPPFLRLVDATLAFYDSRFEAFEISSIKSLWTLIRSTLGLSRDYALLHWPGTGHTGPGAMPYEPTQIARRHVSKEALAEEGSIGEACCLLRDTEKAVRGFLAIARRDTDGMWGIERTLLLIDIVTSFLAYLNFHGVITDDYLAPRFARAEQLSRSAALATKLSKKVEDEIVRMDGLNQTSWVMYGGSYLDRQGAPKDEEPEEEDVDDGGWTAPEKSASIVPTVAEARKTLETLLAPVAVGTVKQVNYMPFARRRIVAVLPPEPNASGPEFMRTHHRLRTVPSPWTDEEQWRDHRRRRHDDDHEEEETAETTVVFEKEEATLPEPDELDVWIDTTSLDVTSTDWMIGLGFRARWAEVSDGMHSWWILKLKDFVLPAFWKSTEAERAAAANDPPEPHPAKATRPAPANAASAAAPSATTAA